MVHQHFPGYLEARQRMLDADLNELLETIDALYGRERIEDVTNVNEVRAEALRQVERDWRMEPLWGSV